jgi:hypothetical protein
MALSKSVKFTPIGLSQEIEITNSYHRVEVVSGSKDKITAIYSVRESANSPSALWEDSCEFIPVIDSGENFIKQAYEHLKTLPEFADAVDC